MGVMTEHHLEVEVEQVHSDSELHEIEMSVMGHSIIRFRSLARSLVGQWIIFVQFSRRPESLRHVQTLYMTRAIRQLPGESSVIPHA